MKLRVIALGEILIDFIALEPARADRVTGFLKMPGGAPANLSVALARLGVPVGFISKVGEDAFGRFLVDVLKGERVDTSQVRSCPERTGLAFVFLSKSGERSFLFYREGSADFMIDTADINPNYFDDVEVFHFSSAPLMSTRASRALFKAIKIAQEKEVKISFDPNLRVRHPIDAGKMKRALRAADYLLLTDDEATLLTGKREAKAAVEELLGYADVVALKLGARGSLLTDGAEEARIPPYKVKAVDTTGAGDGYDAAFIYGCLKKWPLEKTGGFANAVGALVTTKKGAMTALPTMSEVKRFMREQSKDIARRR